MKYIAVKRDEIGMDLLLFSYRSLVTRYTAGRVNTSKIYFLSLFSAGCTSIVSTAHHSDLIVSKFCLFLVTPASVSRRQKNLRGFKAPILFN